MSLLQFSCSSNVNSDSIGSGDSDRPGSTESDQVPLTGGADQLGSGDGDGIGGDLLGTSESDVMAA